jgi:YD repeat-containing protein
VDSRERWIAALAAGALIVAAAASATETITYKYDARGRLVQVNHTGTVNDGISATYTYDKADNRSNVTVTGAGMSGMAALGSLETTIDAGPATEVTTDSSESLAPDASTTAPADGESSSSPDQPPA